MKKIYILRGVQGSGKSTFIKNHNLEDYTISSDNLRRQFESTVFNVQGNPIISQDNQKLIWSTLFTLVENRMKKNCLTVVDATHSQLKDIKPYLKLAKKYNYDIKIIEFTVSYDELIKRNKGRPLIHQVKDEVINRYYNRIHEHPLPDYINIISPEDISKELIYDVKDFSSYSKIIFFGDLQGCYSSPQEYFKQNPYRKDYLYIFVGDYIDRGIENSQVVLWLLDFHKKENVILMKGNHEYHLENWANDDKARSQVFNQKTKNELESNNISKMEVLKLCHSLKDFLKFKFNEMEIFVTHAGLPFAPTDDMIYKIPSHQYIKGIGYYSDNIDQLWNEKTKTNQYQVHGHRNKDRLPIINGRSFNLEGQVEYGSYLRVLELDKIGFKEILIKQDVFDKELKRKRDERNMTFLEKLRNSDLIREKDLGNNISSFNFTRKAFYKKEWNDTNIKARGLFFDINKNKIVARSYDKFFNLGERENTQLESLKKTLKFPLVSYQKDNGFLGILSMNNGKLFYASKSTNESDFAKWFQEIVESTLDISALKDILKNEKMTMVFEVNDPLNDPHIIEYKKRHVVLLDIVHNKETFSKIPYTQLRGIAKKINVKVKKQTIILREWQEFLKWYDKVNNEDNLLEGYVLEDSNGFMFKIKLPYYSFWKYMRTVRDRLRKDKDVSDESIKSKGYKLFFVKYLRKLSKDELEKDIISLRKQYYKKQ